MEDYKELYELLNNKFPLKNRDCGKICNKACCSNEHENTGMYLFPDEEQLFKGADWYRIEELSKKEANLYPYDDSIVYKLICNGTCPHDERPLACRIFPTFPKCHGNGTFNMVYDIQSYMICPLAQGLDFKQLDRGFVNAARKVWQILLEDETLFKQYQHASEQYEETINSPWFKLLKR